MVLIRLWLLVGVMALPADAAQGLDHRLKTLDDTVSLWERKSVSWQGLTSATGERFIKSLEEAMKPAQIGGLGEEPDSGRRLRSARVLSLRAAAIFGQGTKSSQLEFVSRSAQGLLELDLAHDPEAVAWALSEVLAWDSSGSASRGPSSDWRPSTKERRIMLMLLGKLGVQKMRGALLAIARREHDPLRGEALTRLAHWSTDFGPDDVVDIFLVKQLGKAAEFRRGPHPVNVMLERIDSSLHPLGLRAQEALRSRIAQLIISSDWRQCAIGLRLSRGMDFLNQIPMLLDGLNVWNQRSRSKREYQSLVRVRGDLTRELRRVSGMKHGPELGPWINWWVEVQQGHRPMPGTADFIAAAEKRANQSVSTASFFGLKPMSDSVTFIIDHSGSMDNNWGTTARSRYTEAIDQMLRFLQGADPGARFNVILFDDVSVRSSLQLVEVTPRILEQARKSLLNKTPGGATLLRPAVEMAMGIGADGMPAPASQVSAKNAPADTIVILCDGATEEGPAWVAPFLERVLPVYPVVFHTVHLGPEDDGTLSELARISGGDFLRVGN